MQTQFVKIGLNFRSKTYLDYLDKKTKIFSWIIIISLIYAKLNFINKLKPYVSYNVPNIDTPVFDAKELFDQTLRNDIVNEYKSKKQPEAESWN